MHIPGVNPPPAVSLTAPDTPSPTPSLQQQARRRVKLKMSFFIHALVFMLVNLGLLGLHAVTGGERGLHAPLWGWAFGLVIHGTVVFVKLHTHGLREQMIAREVVRLQSRR